MTALAHPPRLFSTRALVEICARTAGPRHRVREIPVEGSGPPRSLCALEVEDRLRLRSFLLAPLGLYASPGWEGPLETRTIADVVRRLKGARTRKFSWKVRFDEDELIAALAKLDLETTRDATQVLFLDDAYDHLVSRYEKKCRQEVRFGRAKGVEVFEAKSASEVRAYYGVHVRLAKLKSGYSFIYPCELFEELVRLPETSLLLARFEGRTVAGLLVFRDGDSVVGWHGAMDREFGNVHPMRVLYDEVIRRACIAEARFVNLGGSLGIASLERFKASWGARVVENWQFTWRNPFWNRLERLRRALVA